MLFPSLGIASLKEALPNMPWTGSTEILYTEESVRLIAPPRPGVYGICRSNGWLYFNWIYFGESENIQKSLLDHLQDQQNSEFTRYGPTHFLYELVAGEEQRKQRWGTLLREFNPSCNKDRGLGAAASRSGE